MNWTMFAGAVCVFVGGLITTWPHRRAAAARIEAKWWREAAEDVAIGEFRESFGEIARRIEERSGPTMNEWLLMLVGVVGGLVGALLMSVATAP